MLKVSVLAFVHCGLGVVSLVFLHRLTWVVGRPLLGVLPPAISRLSGFHFIGRCAKLRAHPLLVIKVCVCRQAVFWVWLKFYPRFFQPWEGGR